MAIRGSRTLRRGYAEWAASANSSRPRHATAHRAAITLSANDIYTLARVGWQEIPTLSPIEREAIHGGETWRGGRSMCHGLFCIRTFWGSWEPQGRDSSGRECPTSTAARPGFTLEALETLLPAGVRASHPEHGEGGLRLRLTGPSTAASETGSAQQGTLWLLPDLHYEVSATDLRAALADESSGIPQRVLDPRVAEYAREHGLYDRT